MKKMLTWQVLFLHEHELEAAIPIIRHADDSVPGTQIQGAYIPSHEAQRIEHTLHRRTSAARIFEHEEEALHWANEARTQWQAQFPDSDYYIFASTPLIGYRLESNPGDAFPKSILDELEQHFPGMPMDREEGRLDAGCCEINGEFDRRLKHLMQELSDLHGLTYHSIILAERGARCLASRYMDTEERLRQEAQHHGSKNARLKT